MAKPKPKNTEVGRLMPTSIQVRDDDGTIMLVPANADENRIAGMLMAAKMRKLLEKNIQKYRDQDATLTPKELAELATAAAKIEGFAGDVYKGSEVSLPSSKDNETQSQQDEEVKFEVLIPVKPESPAT